MFGLVAWWWLVVRVFGVGFDLLLLADLWFVLLAVVARLVYC